MRVTPPAASAGLFAVTVVDDAAWTVVAAVEPNVTAVTLASVVPVIVTVVPPAVGPLVGLKLVMAGKGVTTENDPVVAAVTPIAEAVSS